jgi:hypothetical protein
MNRRKSPADFKFKIVCISCGGTIRENASDDSYGLCLRCFYKSLAARFRNQKKLISGEFVSDR